MQLFSARRGCPHSQPKNSQWGGGGCSGGGARRVRLFGVLPTARSRALAIGNVAAIAEQIFITYSLKSNKKKVAKLHVFRAPKNSHVADVARLPFRQFVYSTRTNVLLSDNHHVHCAREEITAFHYVFIEIEQKESGEIACFSGAQKQPCGRCCATAVRAIL